MSVSITIAIVSFLCVLSGISKAIMDKLAFHFERSVFSNTTSWWNPKKSWENKYTWSKGKKFLQWILSNPLVFITDAWHFFQAVFSVSIVSCFFVAGMFLPWWTSIVLYVSNRIIFHIFFTWVFERKN